MQLTDLLTILPFYEMTQKIENISFNSIEMDHRNIQQNDLFVCIKGFSVDGHDFAEQAIANGACAVIAEKEMITSVPTVIVPDTSRALAMIGAKFFDFPTQKFPLVGITGTNGKTTVTYLLDGILQQHQRQTGLIGTIQMKIGKETFPVKNTTPDALFLQKSFRQMVDHQIDVGIMEVSSHALDLGRVYGCDFDMAVYTNLSQDHLDFHRNMEEYLQAKRLLFAQLGNAYSSDRKKFAIINEDDPYKESIKKSTAQHIITYGCQNKAQVMATNIKLEIMKTNFILKTPIGSIEINSSLIGMFNVYNMLAASSAAMAYQVPLPIIKAALENMQGVAGRFEQVDDGQNFATIVDYAHTPDSLENVLKTITEFAMNNVYVVVGCGGDRDRTKRPIMAEIALKYADKAIFTSDNPRTEDPLSIVEEMVEDLDRSDYEVIIDREQAIHYAIKLAKKNDIILIAGKGHETYQEINHMTYDFDDRKIAKEAMSIKEME